MRLQETKERYLIAEVISAITFVVMALSIWYLGTQSVDNNPPPFWMVVMGGFGLLQFISVKYKKDFVTLRLLMAWSVGTAFIWVGYVNRDALLAIPMVMLGLANFVSFIDMCGRVTFNRHTDNI